MMRNDDILTDNELKHHKIAYKEALESIVLLKNDGTLPLKEKGNIALYGNGAEITLNGGTGSGEVYSRYDVSIKEGLEKAGFKITTTDWLEDYKTSFNKAVKKGNKVMARRLLKLSTDNMINVMKNAIKYPLGRKITSEDVEKSKTNVCVYVIARQSGESKDRTVEEISLYEMEKDNLNFILKSYDKVIMVINSGAGLEMSWLKEYSNLNSIVYYGQPGMEGGNALASIITGENTPSGKLADTWYYNYYDIPYSEEYGELSENKDCANYKENIYVGYRYADSFNKDVAYPFGFGLSYTNFEIKFKNVEKEKSKIKLELNVKNIGNTYSGKEVVQVYIGFPNNKLNREYQSLVSFVKTKTLLPQEEQRVTLDFNLKDFAFYDDKTARFLLEEGKYTVRVGNSSKNLQVVAYINLVEDVVVEQCKNVCSLKEKFELLQKENTTKEKVCGSLPFVELCEKDFKKKINDYNSKSARKKQIESVINELSFDDKIKMVVGENLLGTNEVPGAYSTNDLKGKNVKKLIMSDGPSGLRLHRRVGITRENKVVRLEENYPFLQGLPKVLRLFAFTNPKKVNYKYQNVTAFTSPSTLANSWNKELAQDVGRAIGEEMKEYGITFLLGPAINIHRNPLCGRNFEYFSEDPFFTAVMAGYLSKGVQEIEGRYVTLKHYAVNNQETRRTHMTSNVDERTLREIYLKTFKIIIENVEVKAVMSSYNKLNGVYTCNSEDLCINVLRKEWGFKGLVMSDWLSTGRRLASNGLAIACGNDLIMPGGSYYIKRLKKDYKKGLFTLAQLDEAVANILEFALYNAN